MSTPSMAAQHDITAAPRDIDLTHARWRKSSYSGGANDCVEIAELGALVAVRDSKDVGRQPLSFSLRAMRALVKGVTDGTSGQRHARL
ncbi:DUF397 domain-containing protein [Streptomyces mirabilis]|uniref:DUF397 domain-containing protein n=1 Tax=Streptomyces mirabilis TaxID=68239 RepID=UPI00340E796B